MEVALKFYCTEVHLYCFFSLQYLDLDSECLFASVSELHFQILNSDECHRTQPSLQREVELRIVPRSALAYVNSAGRIVVAFSYCRERLLHNAKCVSTEVQLRQLHLESS